jgi:hypothetical protein
MKPLTTERGGLFEAFSLMSCVDLHKAMEKWLLQMAFENHHHDTCSGNFL